jgi:hypothetical protein
MILSGNAFPDIVYAIICRNMYVSNTGEIVGRIEILMAVMNVLAFSNLDSRALFLK